MLLSPLPFQAKVRRCFIHLTVMVPFGTSKSAACGALHEVAVSLAISPLLHEDWKQDAG